MSAATSPRWIVPAPPGGRGGEWRTAVDRAGQGFDPHRRGTAEEGDAWSASNSSGVGWHEIASFHRQLFAAAVKGTQLQGGVRFVRLLTPDWAVIHAWARYANLPGTTEPTPGRDSMQLFVATKRDGRWLVAAVQNSRQLSLEQQQILDDALSR